MNPISELFVSLGVKVSGLARLNKVDELMRTSASNAGVLVQALGQLQQVLTQVQQAAAGAQQGLTQAGTAAQNAATASARNAQQAQKIPPVIRNTGTSAKQSAVDLGKMTAATVLLTGKLALLARGAFQAAVALKNFQQETGLSADTLQRWQYQARLNNVEGERMTALLKSLQTQAADIAMGRGDVTPWRLLGLAPNQDPLEVVDQLGERLRALPKGIARSVAADLGIDDAAFRVLISESEWLSSSYRLGARELRPILDLNRSWIDLTFKLERMANRLFAQMAKPLGVLLDVLNNVVDAVSWLYTQLEQAPLVGNLVRGVLYSLTVAMIAFTAAVAAGTIAIGAQKLGLAAWSAAAFVAIPLTKGLAFASALLAKALTAVGIAGAPIWLIAAAVAAVIVTVQDLITFFRGGESVTGRLVEGVKKLFGVHLELWKGLADGVKAAWDFVVGMVTNSIQTLIGIIPDWLMRLLVGKGEMKIEAPKSYLPEIERFAAAPPVSGGRSTSVEQNNDIRVMVDGAGDARAVGREVGRSMKQVLAEASYQIPLPSY